jgi:hypothetical protein
MKMDKKIMFVFLFVVLSSFALGDAGSGASTFWSDAFLGARLGVPFTNWYDVAPWETKVCFNWGGDRDPNTVFGGSMGGIIYHDLVITMQAQVRNPLPEELEAHINERLYEVAWYVQPTQTDESMNYEVYLIDVRGSSKVLASGSANYVNGLRDYFVEFGSTNYTLARMHYWNDRTDGVVEVPVVE